MELHEALKIEMESISGLSGKVFPISAPEGAKAPYMTYKLSGNNREQGLNGILGLIKSNCELNIYHATYNTLKAIKKSAVQIIKTFGQRSIGNAGPYIQQVEIENDFETYENEVRLYRGIIEINLYYEEV